MVELRINGKRYGYWQSVDIHASVDDLCASVNLGIMSLEQGLGVLPINENTVIEVLADGELAATVRADQLDRKVTASSHAITLDGRSLGRELVDCQYSQTLNNLKLEEIIKRLCTLFKVPLKVLASTALVPDFAMQCEPPANALINAARAANLLLYPSTDGGLILAEPTAEPPVATLEYGIHIKSYSIVDEYKLRFSEYVTKGYDHASASATKGKATDSGFDFFRPLHILADRVGQTLGGCDRRAELERNRRKARAHRIELEVLGWKHPRGLWAINTQVRVVIPPEGIDDVFLIGDRALRLDDNGGTVAQLSVMRREAFIGDVATAKKPSAAKAKAKTKAKKTRRKKPQTVINPGD